MGCEGGDADNNNTGLPTENCSRAIQGSWSRKRQASPHLTGQAIRDPRTRKLMENKYVC